jgi:hypothetical protein
MGCPCACSKHTENPSPTADVQYHLPSEQMLVPHDRILIGVGSYRVLDHFLVDSEVGVAVDIGVWVATGWGFKVVPWVVGCEFWL